MEAHALPILSSEATMRDAVVALAERRGIGIVAQEGRIQGVVTAGDLTRLLEREADILDVPVAQVMTRTPKVAHAEELGSAVVRRMEMAGIMAMPVLDAQDALVGVVHLHDLLRAGVA
jgi:arabinose-5-phosphate isomerase